MTIKTKLTLNIVIVLAIIAAVAVTSFVGMSFVKSRLSYLTERSTPFQMRTVEFKKAIKAVTADLVKVNAARTEEDFRANEPEVARSLEEVKKTQEMLKELSGGAAIETYS